LTVTMRVLRNQGLQRRSPCPGLTTEAVFRLWRAAVKDDDKLVDALIAKIYDAMVSFDCTRADRVIELVINRDPSAQSALAALLADMRALGTRG
jgi:hypothetical protein